MHILGAGTTDQNARDLKMLLLWLASVKGRSHLEQGQIVKPTRLIARRRFQQAGQQIRTHMAHLG